MIAIAERQLAVSALTPEQESNPHTEENQPPHDGLCANTRCRKGKDEIFLVQWRLGVRGHVRIGLAVGAPLVFGAACVTYRSNFSSACLWVEDLSPYTNQGGVLRAALVSHQPCCPKQRPRLVRSCNHYLVR